MNLSKLLFRTAMFAIFVFFTNCDKNGEAPLSNNYEDEYQDPIFQLNDINEIENPAVDDADEANKFRLVNHEKHDGLNPCEKRGDNKVARKECKDGSCRNCHKRNNRGDNGHKRRVEPHELPFILKQMNLSERQKGAVKGFMKEYCECVSSHLKTSHDINKHVLDRANDEREELVQLYKSGRINHNELIRSLKAIKARIIKEMNENNDKRARVEMMKKCREGLFRNILSILEAPQKEKFQRWVTHVKNR